MTLLESLTQRAMSRKLSRPLNVTSLEDWQDYIRYQAEMDTRLQHKRRCLEAVSTLELEGFEEATTWPILKLHETVFGFPLFSEHYYSTEID